MPAAAVGCTAAGTAPRACWVCARAATSSTSRRGVARIGCSVGVRLSLRHGAVTNTLSEQNNACKTADCANNARAGPLPATQRAAARRALPPAPCRSHPAAACRHRRPREPPASSRSARHQARHAGSGTRERWCRQRGSAAARCACIAAAALCRHLHAFTEGGCAAATRLSVQTFRRLLEQDLRGSPPHRASGCGSRRRRHAAGSAP